jgi:hypothetical protein
MRMIIINTLVSLLMLSALSGCYSTQSPSELRALPDSYFINKGISRTHAEDKEWARRYYDRRLAQDMRAACIFGTRPAIDRSKMGCEKVKGSPEYKALHDTN